MGDNITTLGEAIFDVHLKDCPLKPEEVQHFTDTARQIGAILELLREG